MGFEKPVPGWPGEPMRGVANGTQKIVWFRNRLSLGLGLSNKGLGESRILPFATPNGWAGLY